MSVASGPVCEVNEQLQGLNRWDAAQQGLNDVLAQISRAVGNAHDTNSSTESTNASTWG